METRGAEERKTIELTALDRRQCPWLRRRAGGVDVAQDMIYVITRGLLVIPVKGKENSKTDY